MLPYFKSSKLLSKDMLFKRITGSRRTVSHSVREKGTGIFCGSCVTRSSAFVAGVRRGTLLPVRGARPGNELSGVMGRCCEGEDRASMFSLL